MAFQIADLYATIRADDAQIQGALPHIQRKLKRVQKSMEGVARIARRMFIGVAAVIGLTVKQASDAEEAHNKFMTVFRDEGKAVSEWAKTYGTAVGRAQVDMETYLGTIQDTLVPLGLARKEATKLSKEIVKLGLDLASFNNEADRNALDNLQSALVGQSRAVLKYGVVVNQAQIQQELLNMGIERSYDLTTNQEKVQARLNIIFRSTTDAQGDLIRTQGSFENQSKALVSGIKDMNAQLGQVFIPTLVRAMRSIRTVLPGIASWVTQNKGLVLGIAGVTTAVLAFLAVAPLLIGALTVLAAHPVVAAVLLIAATIGALTVRMKLARAEIRGLAHDMAGVTPSGGFTLENTERRLALLRRFAKDQKAEIKRQKAQFGAGTGRIAKHFDTANIRKAEDILAGYNKKIKELVTLQETLAASAEAAAKAEGELADELDRVLTKTEMAKIAADDEMIRRSRLSKRKLAQEELLDEIEELKASADATDTWEERKTNIGAYWAEQRDKINKEFDAKELAAKEAQLAKLNALYAKAAADRKALEAKAEELARGKVGGVRRTGFSGLVEFGRSIQESILKKGEDDRRDKLLQEIKEVEMLKLEQLREMNITLGGPLLQAMGFALTY